MVVNCTLSQFQWTRNTFFLKSNCAARFTSCSQSINRTSHSGQQVFHSTEGQKEPAEPRRKSTSWVSHRRQCQYLPIAVKHGQVKMESAVFQSPLQRPSTVSEYPYGNKQSLYIVCLVWASADRKLHRLTGEHVEQLSWEVQSAAGLFSKMYVTVSVQRLFYFFAFQQTAVGNEQMSATVKSPPRAQMMHFPINHEQLMVFNTNKLTLR